MRNVSYFIFCAQLFLRSFFLFQFTCTFVSNFIFLFASRLIKQSVCLKWKLKLEIKIHVNWTGNFIEISRAKIIKALKL